ncbi:MAG: LamG domain-containing protein, partial [Chloroflexi bacterium]|nr:LamG domain-containing protein [Chloroflexota bacterium]
MCALLVISLFIVNTAVADFTNIKPNGRGSLDEVKIYKEALSPDEVQAWALGSPLASWSFEEGSGTTAVDVTGNGYDGALNGGIVWSTATESGSGYALSFDGVDDYVTLPHIIDPAKGDFSASLWFNVSDYTDYRRLLQQQDGTGVGRNWLGINTSGQLYTWLGGVSMDSGTTTVST